jgi:hypothetical protein
MCHNVACESGGVKHEMHWRQQLQHEPGVVEIVTDRHEGRGTIPA